MRHGEGIEARGMVRRDVGQRRSAAPGILAMWNESDGHGAMKEVIAVIRPSRWTATKARVQRLDIPAFTQQRVLGRGSEGGLWCEQASDEATVRYLPKRMVSWVVEAPLVNPLVQAIIEANRTGQPGDGKVFVLPIDGALRVRTGERAVDALRPAGDDEPVVGTMREDDSQETRP